MMGNKCGKITKVLTAMSMGFILAACGVEYDTPSDGIGSVRISKNGSIEAVLIDDFSKAEYSESELESFIKGELAEYNTAHGSEKITMEGHELSGGVMKLSLKFASSEDYDAYMPDSLFTGTVQEAYDKGYDMDQALVMADTPEHVIGKNDLMNMADRRLLVFSGKKSISVPSKIKYYTQSMKLTDKNTAEASEDGTYIIIY